MPAFFNTRRLRRRWRALGHAAADFICGFLFAVLEHGLRTVWSMLRRAANAVYTARIKRFRLGHVRPQIRVRSANECRGQMARPSMGQDRSSDSNEEPPRPEAMMWLDVWGSNISIDGKGVRELACCDRELISLISTGQSHTACRACGRPVTAKLGPLRRTGSG